VQPSELKLELANDDTEEAYVKQAGTVPISQEEAEVRASRWAAAWNSGDVEEVLSHFHANTIFRSPVAASVVGTGEIRGKEELRSYWREALRRIGDLQFTVFRVMWDSERREMMVLYRAKLGDTTKRVCERMVLDSDGLVVEAEAFYGAVVAEA
jgi:hypothetical protein